MFILAESNKRMVMLFSMVIRLAIILFASWIGGWAGVVIQTIACCVLTGEILGITALMSNLAKGAAIIASDNGRLSEKKWKKFVVDFANKYHDPDFWISVVMHIVIVAALCEAAMIWVLLFYLVSIIAAETTKQRLFNYMKDEKNLTNIVAAAYVNDMHKFFNGKKEDNKQ